MRRPLVGIAVGVVAGTWLGLTVGAAAVAWGGALVAGGLFWVAWIRRWETLSLIALHALIVMTIWFCAARSRELSITSVFEAVCRQDSTPAVIEGVVQSDVTDVAGDDAHAGRLQFLVRVRRVATNGSSRRVRDTLRVMLYGSPRYPPLYGERWRLEGRLLSPRNGRGSCMFITGLRDAERLAQTRAPFLAWSYAARRRAARTLALGVADYPEVTGVVHAMVLGYRTQLPAAVRRCFMHTGTMHVFAISGLHVGILCTIIVFVLAVLRVPRTGWVLALAPLIFTYAAVTGARASAIRAGAMAAAYLLAPLVRRRGDAVSALALAASGILVWNPSQLMDMGFLYSFTVVAGIMLIVPLFDPLWNARFQPDLFLTPELARRTAAWHYCGRILARVVTVSAAAWLTSTPLSLYFFGRFSLVALLGNVVAVPLAFLIIMTGCLALVGGSLFASLGVVFNHANWCFVQILLGMMRTLERIPFGWVEGVHFPLWGVLVWYALLIGGVIYLKRRRASAGVGFSAEAVSGIDPLSPAARERRR